ncbi:unnamed protein product [Amoebophrya sp. A120]|nr:unnamed protein product [Amoebophrya sp. A120]|eukprot:GSA120T00003776001.1
MDDAGLESSAFSDVVPEEVFTETKMKDSHVRSKIDDDLLLDPRSGKTLDIVSGAANPHELLDERRDISGNQLKGHVVNKHPHQVVHLVGTQLGKMGMRYIPEQKVDLLLEDIREGKDVYGWVRPAIEHACKNHTIKKRVVVVHGHGHGGQVGMLDAT